MNLSEGFLEEPSKQELRKGHETPREHFYPGEYEGRSYESSADRKAFGLESHSLDQAIKWLPAKQRATSEHPSSSLSKQENPC